VSKESYASGGRTDLRQVSQIGTGQ
jgi:hypothetical protein